MFKRNTLITAALLLFSFQAFAQPGIDVNDATGQIGMQVVVNVDYLSDGVEQNLQFDIDYDDTILTVNSCDPVAMNTAGGTVTATCQNPGPDNANSLRFLTVNLTGAINAGTQSVATITFDIDPMAVAGMTNLTLNDVGFGSGAPPVGNSDGTITISAGPVGLYGSTPAPGATLTFGPILGGSPAPTQSITINNDGGDPGSTLTGTCALSGPDAGTFTITTDGAFSIAQGGAGDTETVSCATGANGTFTASLDCSHDGSNASPASYPLTCTVNPPFANVVPTPANGTQRTILVPAIGGMGNTSVTFNETENNGVDGSIDTCSISGVDAAQFTVTAPAAFPATVPAGGSVQVTVNGVEPGTGMPVAAALDCTLGDGIGGTTAVSFPLQFLVQPQVVPTLNQWAMILMGLFLAGAGFFTLRRRVQ